jgi:hypothetical protein
MLDVQVIDDPAVAVAALDPVRARLLAELGEPASAAMLAGRLELPRQKINYHLRTLADHALVQPTSTRNWGGITERLFVASAASYVVSPAAFGAVGVDPRRSTDRLSARYAIALGARLVRELGQLLARAESAGRRVPTLSIDTEITFASAATRAAFAEDLADAVHELAARYHDENNARGRRHRLIVAVHPVPKEESI